MGGYELKNIQLDFVNGKISAKEYRDETKKSGVLMGLLFGFFMSIFFALLGLTPLSKTRPVHGIIFISSIAGIVGGLFLGWFVLVLVAGLLRTVWREPARTSVALGAIALLIHFGLDIDVSYPALVFLLAILAGLAYRQRHESQAKLSVFVPAVALVSFIVLMGAFQSGANYNRGLSAQAERD